jgi:hypothetical protein
MPEGRMPEWPRRAEDADFFFVEAATPEEGAAKMVEIVRDRIPRRFGLDPVGDVQVLCPMQRGALGARALNANLQKALNPYPSDRIERFGSVVAPGDKLIQTENDYDREVFNGDLGRLVRIDLEEGALVASFDGREVTYSFGELAGCHPRLRDHDPQVAGVRISRCRRHACDAALHHAGAEPRLHRGHPRETARRDRGAEAGFGHRHQERADQQALDQVGGVAWLGSSGEK